MAGAAGRLIAALALIAAAPPTAPVRALAGSYHDRYGNADIIPIDRDHAYVHLYFRFGLLGDKICEFEGVATAAGTSLVYHRAGSGPDDPPCHLTLRRAGGRLTWKAADLSCTQQYCPNRSLADGGFPWASRRRGDRTTVLKGEGVAGYADTVAAWRSDRAGR